VKKETKEELKMLKKVLSLVLGVAVVLGLAACTDLSTEVSGYYVSVDINPSIEFTVDEDGNVDSFIFLNEDAAILCSDLDFTGMYIDDAVELFVQTATDAGYVDPDGEENAVLITVLGEENDEPQLEQIRERIRERVVRQFARNYINGVVLTEEFTQEDLVAEAEELGVSAGKLKLAYAAMAADETLVLEDLLDMPVKDILAMVKELHEEEWTEFKATQMEQLQQQLQARLDANQARLEEYIANHPELSEEEIDAIVEEAKEQFKSETMEQWQNRVERWNQFRQENDQNNEDNNSSTDNE
jgi:hypothetical protein